MKVLILPDGSAIESKYVKAITWEPSSPGQYGHKAFIRIYGYKAKERLGFGLDAGSSGLEQIHYIRMESDEEAKSACADLVNAWTGPAMRETAAEAG